MCKFENLKMVTPISNLKGEGCNGDAKIADDKS